jgi:hypothetical protein
MVRPTRLLVAGLMALTAAAASSAMARDQPEPTKEFSVRGDRAYLGGQPFEMWGIRSGNALYDDSVTDRHIRALDTMVAHGVNTIGLYIQGSNSGYPDADAGHSGFKRDGRLKPEFADRLERLVRAADERGMVIMVGVLSPRKDQELYDEEAIKKAIQETAAFLEKRGLRNVFVDLMHEFSHPERIDHALLREPDGEAKKAKLTAWFKEVAPEIEVGVCPTEKGETADSYPGMDVRIIQKQMEIPSQGYVVNVEPYRYDFYENDGIYSAGTIAEMEGVWSRFKDAPNAALLFHSAWIQGLGNKSATAPHPELGGMGTGPDDRGVRFYYEWVRDHVGRWEYPRHVPAGPEGGAK